MPEIRVALAEDAETEPTGDTTVAAAASTATEGAEPGPSVEAKVAASPQVAP